MSEKNDRELEGLFDRAEGCGSCLVPGDARLRMALRRRMGEGGTVVSPARGMYARGSTWEGLDPADRALAVMRGLQRQHPGWVFCGPSAALVMGADVSWGLLDRIHLVAPPGGTRSTPGLARHAIALDEGAGEAPVWHAGVRVTPLARTVLDCLRWLDFREGLVVADWAVRGPAARREQLGRYLESQRDRCRGVDRALRTLACADGRAESGGESIARAVMLEQDYAPPMLQVAVPDPTRPGHFFRVDFLWLRTDGRVIVGECDGRRKLVDPRMTGGLSPGEALDAQRRREGLITAYDVSVLRFCFEEAAGVGELVSKLELYGVPRAGSPLAWSGPEPQIDWRALLRH